MSSTIQSPMSSSSHSYLSDSHMPHAQSLTYTGKHDNFLGSSGNANNFQFSRGMKKQYNYSNGHNSYTPKPNQNKIEKNKPKFQPRAKTDHDIQTNTNKKQKRSKKEQKKWKKKMKEIGKNHPEFELSYDLLLGIRTSTSTVNSSIIRSSANPSDDDSSDDDELRE